MARRKPMMGGMRGGMPMRDGMMGRGGKCSQYLLLDYFTCSTYAKSKGSLDLNSGECCSMFK